MILGITLSSTELNRKIQFDSTASFYHDKFQNRKTALGERFDQNKLTAANNKLPLGTMVKVTRIIEKETLSVEVKINDRTHPRFSHRIDLSRSAAKKLNLLKDGVASVQIEVL